MQIQAKNIALVEPGQPAADRPLARGDHAFLETVDGVSLEVRVTEIGNDEFIGEVLAMSSGAYAPNIELRERIHFRTGNVLRVEPTDTSR